MYVLKTYRIIVPKLSLSQNIATIHMKTIKNSHGNYQNAFLIGIYFFIIIDFYKNQ